LFYGIVNFDMFSFFTYICHGYLWDCLEAGTYLFSRVLLFFMFLYREKLDRCRGLGVLEVVVIGYMFSKFLLRRFGGYNFRCCVV
jgi:hypothetical protein